MKIKGSSYFLIAIMAAMLIIIGSALGMEYVASKTLPLVFGGVIFVLAGIGLLRDIRSQAREVATTDEGDVEEVKQPVETWRGYMVNSGWFAGLILGIFMVGFNIAVPIFLLVYMRYLGTKWLTAVGCAVLTPVVIYFVFQVALGLDLYPGLVFKWFG